MQVKFVDLNAQYSEIKLQIDSAIARVLDSAVFIGGPEKKEFENNFSKYLGAKHCVGVGNGTDALYISLKSLGIGKEDEVIVPANSFIATAEAVGMTGAKVVFVDCCEQSFNLGLEGLKNKISKNTKAIIPVHLYGNPVDMEPILNISRENNIAIIEDAAQAHGAEFNKLKVGTIGHAGCFSFFPGKNLGAYGDAGIITTNSKKKYEYLKKIRNLGSEKKYYHDIIGVNSRLDTIQALILSKKLKNLDRYNSNRKKIANIYNKNIVNYKITKLQYSKGCVFHQYVLVANNIKKFSKYLKSQKIPFGRHYPFPIHKLKAVKNLFINKKFPYSENLAKNGISIPIDPLMKISDAFKVCKIINNYK